MNKEMFKNIRRFMIQQKYFYFNIPFVKFFKFMNVHKSFTCFK